MKNRAAYQEKIVRKRFKFGVDYAQQRPWTGNYNSGRNRQGGFLRFMAQHGLRKKNLSRRPKTRNSR